MLCCTNCYVIDKFQIVTAEFPSARCARIVRSPIGSIAIDPRKFGYDFTERLSDRLSVCPQSKAGERGDFRGRKSKTSLVKNSGV